MCAKQQPDFWLLPLLAFFFSLLAALPAHGQEAAPPEPLPASTTLSLLSSYGTSELWSLYYTTLTRLEAQSAQDRLALEIYRDSSTSTIEALQSDLTTATTALHSSELSAESSSDEARAALALARRRLIEARVAEVIALLALGGLAASLFF